MRWNQIATLHSGDDSEIGKGKQKAHLIVATDACLPLLNSGESPIAALVLIKYEISTKTETYMTRLTTCLAQVNATTIHEFFFLHIILNKYSQMGL
ncbi:hypothetical protein LOK49_LG01G03321 [Camellia lanceoleosa]|uniref:Uncharacterized protein n=1 Tax=Camellia lanceoleosa TaxID=1840588 RepID=A0ACC0IWS8_9ERIC|nr:hypothetical protein LOK49_LG01G03321 [Camellia lanceoleosa]